MVDHREERRERTRIAKGSKRKTGKAACVFFNDELFEQIRQEAVQRQWTFSHMVRHLCEASIDGLP